MMRAVEFSIVVSYSQVTVFAPLLDRPFNRWTDKHVAQGFSWRPGSASFRTIADGGRHLVTVAVDSTDDEQPLGAIRVIDVPFEVPDVGTVEIGSISDGFLLEIPSGTYSLRFECYELVSGQTARVRFLFTRNKSPEFSIVRADPGLSPVGELLLTTSAA